MNLIAQAIQYQKSGDLSSAKQIYCDLLQIEHSSLVGELVGTGQDH